MDALYGVIIGGLIAWIAPLLTLRYTERRWRFESKLTYLKSEYARFEKMYEINLVKFESGLKTGSYSSDMDAEIYALMPDEISKVYSKWQESEQKDELSCKGAYWELALAMKADLAKRNAEIAVLFDK
jgi:hypothetical protein